VKSFRKELKRKYKKKKKKYKKKRRSKLEKDEIPLLIPKSFSVNTVVWSEDSERLAKGVAPPVADFCLARMGRPCSISYLGFGVMSVSVLSYMDHLLLLSAQKMMRKICFLARSGTSSVDLSAFMKRKKNQNLLPEVLWVLHVPKPVRLAA
jgi:hypothetical protein